MSGCTGDVYVFIASFINNANPWQFCGRCLWEDISSSQHQIIQTLQHAQSVLPYANVCQKIRRGPGFLQHLVTWFRPKLDSTLPLSQLTNRAAGPQGTQESTGPEEISDRRQPAEETSQSHNREHADLRILFGVQASRKTLELIQITDGEYTRDGFFVHLRNRHKVCRGPWRHLLSFWQFSHCDFVRVCKFTNMLLNSH